MNLSLKDNIIKKIVVLTGIPEKVIREVVDDSFGNAAKACLTHKSVEIGGWGKFIFCPKTAATKEKKYKSQIEVFSNKVLDETLPEYRKATYANKLKIAQENLKEVEERLYGT